MQSILLVDDDRNYREVLAMALELHGYQVLQAAGVTRALELVRREPPDLIISDLEMNGLDGRAFCKQIRCDSKISNLPFIILSAFIDPDSGSGLPDLPADLAVSKQISNQTLIGVIRSLLDDTSRRRA
jgi:CheY-like chemotaxis protein